MIEILNKGPVIPVIVIDDVTEAVPLAQALRDGGVQVLEITLRTAAAADAIRAITRGVPEVVVGAGTILNAQDLQRARTAGAHFGVSPGLTDELLAAARGWNFLPGVATASEMMIALAAGYSAVKFFPAALAGGLRALKAYSGPFPQLRFCPTGDITFANAPDYLALPNVVCVGGSWLAPRSLVQARDWPAITRLARKASALRRPGRVDRKRSVS